jgi:glyoxylase-like metal-dependent hydrolase (beta-lactamase superfamily II)
MKQLKNDKNNNIEIMNFIVNEFGTNCYIYKDDMSDNAVIIDPGGDMNQIISLVHQRGFRIVNVVVTHGHYDHIKGLGELVKLLPNIGVVVYEEELSLILDDEENLSILFADNLVKHLQNINWIKVKDGEELVCGTKKIKIIHTPGHTSGSMCLYIKEKNFLFTGDTLFCGSVGRTDFPTGNIEMIEESIQKIFSLPLNTKFFPGHGNCCVLEKEIEHNMFVKIAK